MTAPFSAGRTGSPLVPVVWARMTPRWRFGISLWVGVYVWVLSLPTRLLVTATHSQILPLGDLCGIPNITLRFNSLLEGLTELRKDVILTVMVYCGERIQIKITKETGVWGGVLEKPGLSFQLSSPSGVTGTALRSPSLTAHVKCC